MAYRDADDWWRYDPDADTGEWQSPALPPYPAEPAYADETQGDEPQPVESSGSALALFWLAFAVTAGLVAAWVSEWK